MELTDYFQRKTRDDGTTFVTLTDDAPEWLDDAVMAAHDGEWPNDWRYETCESIVEMLAGSGADPSDAAWEIADSLVDVYNHDLYAWATPDRWCYVDEAIENLGEVRDLSQALMQGQFYCIERMALALADAIEENAGDES